MTILLTGGTGFIGSHTVISLIQSGFDVVILDNLSNSSVKILPRLQQITGKPVQFYQGDIRDREIYGGFCRARHRFRHSFCRSESGWRECGRTDQVL